MIKAKLNKNKEKKKKKSCRRIKNSIKKCQKLTIFCVTWGKIQQSDCIYSDHEGDECLCSMSKLSSKLRKNENNTNIRFYQIYLSELH